MVVMYVPGYVHTWLSLVLHCQTAFFHFFIRGAEIPPPRIKRKKAFWIRLLIAKCASAG